MVLLHLAHCPFVPCLSLQSAYSEIKLWAASVISYFKTKVTYIPPERWELCEHLYHFAKERSTESYLPTKPAKLVYHDCVTILHVLSDCDWFLLYNHCIVFYNYRFYHMFEIYWERERESFTRHICTIGKENSKKLSSLDSQFISNMEFRFWLIDARQNGANICSISILPIHCISNTATLSNPR